MLHFTFQNMRAFYGPWPRGLGLIVKIPVQYLLPGGQVVKCSWGKEGVTASATPTDPYSYQQGSQVHSIVPWPGLSCNTTE